jgi:hypothetical protein
VRCPQISGSRTFDCPQNQSPPVHAGGLFYEAKAAPFHTIDSVDNLISIENGYQPVHRSRGVARAGCNVFPKDAPGILDSPQQGVLIWLGHWYAPY